MSTQEITQPTILVVDDVPDNIDIIVNVLKNEYRVKAALNGQKALKIAAVRPMPDLILLDLMMPGMDGYQVLEQLKQDPFTNQIPVIFLTAKTDEISEEKGLSLGAVDYITKPISAPILWARIKTHLTLYQQKLEIEKEKDAYQTLLLNMLPATIVERLNAGETEIADHLDDVTVLFADLVGFTSAADKLKAEEIVKDINTIFLAFDTICDKFGVEKVKTIGDSYMAISSLTNPGPEATIDMVDFAIAALDKLNEIRNDLIFPFETRIGIHTGVAVAGVLKGKRSVFDIWGDTVNTAQRIESTGVAGRIHVTHEVGVRLKGKYRLESRGEIELKGKGRVESFLVVR